MIEITEYNEGTNGIPQFQDRKEMWESLIIKRHEDNYPAVNDFVQALKKVYVNGGVRFQSFFIEPSPVFDWYGARNQFYEMGFFKEIWQLPLVKQFMPEETADLNFYKHDVFSWSSPFVLGGNLAWVLASGGPYEKHAKGSVDAKILGDKAAVELIHDDYDETLVFESHAPWSDFFFDVAWDYTWIIIDKRKRLFHILCATDTD